ncbi:uncharacterized protein RCC_10283 [Ramularia collo-cygni]|uniref:BTB domain-containing protein n=1 Tax=Ramularia collo-cygni TaxID=112498 RepID=A0A2D3VQT8_9PEZI|nr:uncharacterized protein RCC_10283 [Ramularia collo-cygni]CZT24558.1 uncharacterized protein RCC_10283 [Ramularia collo-cygni]
MAPTKLQRLTAELEHSQAALVNLRRNYTSQTTCRGALSNATDLGSHILLLFVGPQQELITLHSDMLPDKTKAYLTARAAAEPFRQLPNELPEIVNLYRLFLYTGTVFSIANSDKDEMDAAEFNHGASMDAEKVTLMECYILGTHLHDERFRNAAINALVQKVEEEEEYPTGLAADVYRHTSPGDKLRRLIVDFHVWKGQGEWLCFPHEDAHGPEEFLADVAAATKRAGAMVYWDHMKSPWETFLCTRYHQHAHTQGCVKVIDLSGED